MLTPKYHREKSKHSWWISELPSRIVPKAKTRIESREKGEGVHRVNIPQTLSLLPENPKAGKKCWVFQVCTSRWRGKAQRTLPPLQGHGALKNDPTAQRPITYWAEPTLLSRLQEKPYFPAPATSLRSRLPSPPRLPARLAAFRFPEPQGAAQPRGSPFCSRESASQRCASPS